MVYFVECLNEFHTCKRERIGYIIIRFACNDAQVIANIVAEMEVRVRYILYFGFAVETEYKVIIEHEKLTAHLFHNLVVW